MGIADTKVGPFGVWQIIAIIGALLGIIAFFLAWGNYTLGLGGALVATGMDFLGSNWSNVSDFQKYAPLLVLVFGVIALILSVIPEGKIPNPKIAPIIVLISGLLMLVFAVLFIVWWGQGISIGGVSIGKASADIGCYLGLIGGVLVLIPSVLPLFKKNA